MKLHVHRRAAVPPGRPMLRVQAMRETRPLPGIKTHLRRVADGKCFTCEGRWERDRQVRLESCTDTEVVFPCAPALFNDYHEVTL